MLKQEIDEKKDFQLNSKSEPFLYEKDKKFNNNFIDKMNALKLLK